VKRTTKIKTSMKTIEGKSLEGIPFTLKASHSSKLCSKHCLQLDRMIKRKREEEEASHVVEPAQMLPESQEDSQESQVTKFPTAVSRELVVVKQGPPLKYDDLTRFQLAATAVKGVTESTPQRCSTTCCNTFQQKFQGVARCFSTWCQYVAKTATW